MKSVTVIFKDPKYNYSTSVNANCSNEEIITYFTRNLFNMGGIQYDHDSQKEIEVDDLQQPINVIFNN